MAGSLPLSLPQQLIWLFVLAIPIACIARTIVFEEVFREPREWCRQRSQKCRRLIKRKFFYVFTCEYCFSHWVTLAAVIFTRFKMLLPDWRGYVIAFFALVFVANAYLNLYSRLRVDIASEKTDIERKQQSIEQHHSDSPAHDRSDRDGAGGGTKSRQSEPVG